MRWLIPKTSLPVACPCDNTTTITKKHFFLQSPLLHSDLELLDLLLLKQHFDDYIRPTLPTTEIDFFLNKLPKTLNPHTFKLQHWQHTWPVLNKILFTIDKLSHPSATFDEEPTHDQLAFIVTNTPE